MANSAQAIKRARQAETRRRRNQGVNTKFRTMLKRARAVTVGADGAAAFSEMQAAADIAARKGIIHPKKAARLKSRVSKSLRKVAQQAPAKAAQTEVADAADAAEADGADETADSKSDDS